MLVLPGFSRARPQFLVGCSQGYPAENFLFALILDDRQITHLICVHLRHLLYDLLGGVSGLLRVIFLLLKAKHPLKSHIANVLGGHRLDE